MSRRSPGPTGRGTVRVAADPAERALLWKGRKSAFGAIARIAPNYYLHDCVVPRTRLVEVLAEVYRIADRHELDHRQRLPRRRRQPPPADRLRPPAARACMERVHAAGEEIVEACVAAGGVLSGEHGIGLEKRDYMPLMFSDGRPRRPGLAARRLRSRRRAATLRRCCPGGSRAATSQNLPPGAWV